MHRIVLLAGCLAFVAIAHAQEANMTGLKSHPCLLVSSDGLAALRAKAADATDSRFGFKTADVWAAIKTKADKRAARPFEPVAGPSPPLTI